MQKGEEFTFSVITSLSSMREALFATNIPLVTELSGREEFFQFLAKPQSRKETPEKRLCGFA
jgi:hypothetical protein